MTNIDTMKPIIASAISNPAGTCGHGCEGNAYQIAIRQLKRHVAELQAELKAAREQEPVGYAQLTKSGKVSFCDGKPMFMAGSVGNDIHPHPIYAHPIPAEPAKALELVQTGAKS